MEYMFHNLYILMRCLLKHSIAILCLCVVTVAGAEAALSEETGVRETDVRGEAAEMHLPADQSLTPWIHDPAIFEKDEGDRTEMRKVVEPDVKTIKLNNLVPPVHFGLGEVEITENYLKILRGVLDSMRDRANVRLHFLGHADSLPLRGELIKIYGDNVGLSRERAGTVAEYCQRALNLPPEAISYEGLGDSHPVADNTTEKGRQLNRRVEVQVWYDEISQKQVEKEVVVPREVNRIKVCRTETVCKLRYKNGHAHRARVKNMIPPLHYDKGMLGVPEKFLQQVRQAMPHLGGKQNLVIKFTAYTDNIPLKGRDERIYGDPVGLSKAVARRVALDVQDDLGLPNAAIETEGRGASQPVTSNDTQQGRALNRRVEVELLPPTIRNRDGRLIGELKWSSGTTTRCRIFPMSHNYARTPPVPKPSPASMIRHREASNLSCLKTANL
jgi:flagellar motor protein MotB